MREKLREEAEFTGDFVDEPWLPRAHRKFSGVGKVGDEARQGPSRTDRD